MKVTPNIQYDRYEHVIETIESHTQGEAARIIIGGFPEPEGETMIEKRKWLEEHCGYLRTALMMEPRGHRDMFGAVLVKPVHEEADLGVVYMESAGFENMCGHGTIALATMAVETGLVEAVEPYTDVVLDAPAGLIRVKVKVENGRPVNVTFTNVPSFLYQKDVVLEIDQKPIHFDISYGGNFYAMVDASQLDIGALCPANVAKYTDVGMKLVRKIKEEIKIKHPTLDITNCSAIEFYGDTPNPDIADMRNMIVFGDSQTDRSPCGTGTSAKLATMHAKGQIEKGTEFRYESFIGGSTFTGVILEETTVGDLPAIIPQITGSAKILGTATFVIDPEDLLKYGFSLS